MRRYCIACRSRSIPFTIICTLAIPKSNSQANRDCGQEQADPIQLPTVEEFRHAPTDAKAPGRSRQPCGGCRRTPFPSGWRLVKASQRHNAFSAGISPRWATATWGPSMKSALASWQLWAVLSAGFAALTAIFAKIGVENVNSDFATFVRTIVILCALGAILAGTGQWQSPGTVSVRSYTFLVLSGLATGGSWVCYFRALKLGD